MTRKIMLVDDDPGMVKAYQLVFEQYGFGVLKAHDGVQALEMVEEITPDIFVLDVMMPYMDGIELCRLLRARPATAQTPIIFLTAKADGESRQEALDAGGDDYLVKPFHPRDLIEKVQRLLDEPTEIRSEG